MATHYVYSGASGAGNGDSWTDAYTSIAACLTGEAIAGGDIIKVHYAHNKNTAGAITWTFPETGTGLVQILSVDKDNSDALRAGALETTGGNSAFTIGAPASAAVKTYMYGMTIQAGANGNSANADIYLGGTGDSLFEACNFYIYSSSSSAIISCGGSSTYSMEFVNCTFTFGASAQHIEPIGYSQYIKLRNCKLAGTAITSFIYGSASRGFTAEAMGCDFSNASYVVNQSIGTKSFVRCSNCVIASPVTGTHAGYGGQISEFHACDPVDGTNGANILSYYYEDAAGNVQDSETVYKATSGAQGEQDDGTDTSYSLEMNPSTLASPSNPLYTPWIYTLVGSTGDKTVTMHVGHTESAVLTQRDLFMEIEDMGEPGATGTQRVANAPHSQMEVDDGCPVETGTIYRNVISAGSNRTDDGIDDWTGLSSEKEHTLTASINCAEVGYIRCRVGLTKDTTNPVYVDPKVNVA